MDGRAGGWMDAMNGSLMKVTGALALGLVLLDAAWLALAAPFDLAGADLRILATTAAMMGTIALVCALLRRRLAGDASRVAGMLRHGARAAGLIAATGGFLILVTAAMAVANYLMMTTALPLRDDTFAAMDRALGFDWPAMLAWVDARPVLARVLVAAYASSLPQMMAVIFVFGALGRADRLLEFAALYTLTGVAVAGVAMLVPAMGAYAHHAPDPALFDGFTRAGHIHIDTLERLRAGMFGTLGLEETVGMVSFPSFHTVLAVIVTWAFRGTPVLVPVLALNVLVVLSTLPEGGHYLVDLFGGAAIAAGAILLVHRIGREGAARGAPAAALPAT